MQITVMPLPASLSFNIKKPHSKSRGNLLPYLNLKSPSFNIKKPHSESHIPTAKFLINFRQSCTSIQPITCTARMEYERTVSLLQYMEDEGLVPSEKEEIRRRNVIVKLKEIAMAWAKRIAYQHRLPASCIRAASATILTYGSYGLGVHYHESDVDALFVGPGFATMAEDFFIILRDMLESEPEVSGIHCIKDAKVPLIRFKFDGVSVDLPYAKIHGILSVPEDVDVFNPSISANMDEKSWRSLSGVRANRSIFQLVPNLQLFGFFGGIHLAVLAAVICQRYPYTWICALVSVFFKTFAFWPWPTPVILLHGRVPTDYLPTEKSLMPIQLPCSPNEYCHSYMTTSTFHRIREEFLRGHHLTKDVLSSDFDWKGLFEPFSYAYHYARFLKIRLSSSDREELGVWVGWVKSRLRFLLVKLEDLLGFCDPNPTEYVDATFHAPNMVFFWGLTISRGQKIDIDAIKEEFAKNINSGREGPLGEMEISVAKASELPDMDPERTESCRQMAMDKEYQLPQTIWLKSGQLHLFVRRQPNVYT